MSIKRALLAATVGLVALPATAHAVPDYPPSGAIVEIEGNLITGEVIVVRVRNCTLGEVVRTSVDSLSTTESICDSPIASFASPEPGSGRRPGLASRQLRLPNTPQVLQGSVELSETGETLSFVLDVRGLEQAPSVESTLVTDSNGRPWWPFLILAAMISAGATYGATSVAGKRRRSEQP